MANGNDSKLVELVNLWAAHSAGTPDLSIEEFCVKVLAERSNVHLPDIPEGHNPASLPARIDGYLGMLIGKLNKYTNLYFKKAFHGMTISHLEDVVYLKVLDGMGNPRKTDLISSMVSEFPSGIDVIKRLMTAGFVVETPDEQDRRSKRLQITPEGLAFLETAIPQLDRVAELAFCQINAGEKALLLNVLGRLDAFHGHHLKEVRQLDFEAAAILLSQPLPVG